MTKRIVKVRRRPQVSLYDLLGAYCDVRKRETKRTDPEVAKILEGHYHPKRHSDGGTPWQFVLGDYEVRFSDKTPRGITRRDEGSCGIYLRAYNVRVATFADNSDHLREALAKMFDAAHALSESRKAVERQTKGNHERQSR